jgi:hypothetical protein
MRFVKHLKTVLRHKYHVCRVCRDFGILGRGLWHDLSKLSPQEFRLYKYATGVNSPVSEEKKLKGYSSAWHRHKGLNRHHFEWWLDIREGQLYAIKPEWPDILEILADWIGAGIAYGHGRFDEHEPLAYFVKRKDRHFMHPAMRSICHLFLTMLDLEGYAKACSYLSVLETLYNEQISEPKLVC